MSDEIKELQGQLRDARRLVWALVEAAGGTIEIPRRLLEGFGCEGRRVTWIDDPGSNARTFTTKESK